MAYSDPPRTRLEPLGDDAGIGAGSPQGRARCERFRPIMRPPMAKICVLDDGADDGQWHRVHSDTFVIGRDEGDLRLHYEPLMSGQHLKLSREYRDGRFTWIAKDLGSSNGTFVRVGRAQLHDRQEILIGRTRLRFGIIPTTPAAAEAANASSAVQTREHTQVWRTAGPVATVRIAAKLESVADGPRREFHVGAEGAWIGRDGGKCSVLLDDALVEPTHARVNVEDGHWHITDAGSLNGVWIAVSDWRVESNVEVQLGEQRLRIVTH